MCGIWLGYGYQCYTLDSTGNEQYYTVPLEVIAINQIPDPFSMPDTLGLFLSNDSVYAVKIIGDPCVPAGYKTFAGVFSQTNMIDAVMVMGSPDYPASSLFPFTIFISDSIYMETAITYYIKATCKQIDSLGINPSEWLNNCEICPELTDINESQIKLSPPYPNPANQYISFDFSTLVSKIKLRVYNSIGSIINTITLCDAKTLTFDTSALNPGLYLYSISINNNPEKTGRFVVVK
ncbi:MAG: T9SS type A sorting domain-containing protein [Sphingobacteriales bacterium JAD_PAG50586_3]|nr:MAG: T9SS type A sorting domain-containing protein [Sphingobacteriales bacterium JAD_PAG50586_3]